MGPRLEARPEAPASGPTFIRARLVSPAGGLNFHNGHPYVAVTASVPGQDSATVWTEASGLTMDPGAPAAQTADDPHCVNVRQTADGYILGSWFTQAEMSATGVGGAFDCGVKYTSPGTFQLQVSISWSAACLAPGNGAAVEQLQIPLPTAS